MLIRYINPDKAHNRRACSLRYEIAKDRYFDGNVYARYELTTFHFRANCRARKLFEELKKERIAWRRGV